MLLAGDIGGTKTNLAILSAEAGPRAPLAQDTFPSPEYASLEALVRDFLAQGRWEVESAVFGVAGPVVAGRARITNLPWVVDAEQMREALSLSSVRLLNDLESIANAVPFLEPGDLETLSEGEPVAGGAIAIVAPGTGLGEAYLAWDGTRYRAYASEGGHASFAPADPLQLELLGYLQEHLGHVSCERVCSGQAIPSIYDFLRDTGRAQEPAWLVEQLAAAEDPAPVISDAALDAGSPCEICITTLTLFASILASEAGNLALKVLATGGVYVGGGIPPRILPFLRGEPFMAAFRSKGRMTGLLARMPVHVILNPKAPLLGAACVGLGL